MKQRLIKVIVCVFLAVSVFLCSGGTALAREITDEDFTGSVEFFGGSWMYLNEVSVGNLAPDSTSKAVYGSLSGSDVITVRFKGLELGRTYSGYVMMNLTFTPQYVADADDVTWHRFNASFSPVTQIDGISIATGHVPTSAVDSLTFSMYVYFNNWYNDIGSELYYTFDILLTHGFFSSNGSVPANEFLNLTKSVDWAGTLYQRLPENGSQLELDAIQDQSAQMNQISQQEMQQQLQIANQQSQQSAQQHEDMKTGFQDDTYNSHVSSAGSQIDSYISQESALMDQQQNRVQDFAADNFNTGLINTYMPAIAAVSGWYTQLWNAFGQFNGAFVAILSLGVAALIIGLRRR